MKKKKFLLIVLSVAMAVLFGLALAACTDEEKTPTISVTSANPATIEVGETYTLEYSLQNAAGGAVVTASGGVFDEDTNEFIASESGSYTLTITATNVEKTATATVTVNVNEPEGPEYVAPVISFASSVEGLTGAVGTPVTIPAVSVESAFAYDLLVDLDVSVQTGITLEKGSEEGTYVLTSSVGGPISVMYIATLKDAPKFEDFEVVTVNFTTASPETTVAEGEGLGEYTSALNKFNAAKEGETVVYNENFANAYDSEFVTWGTGSETDEAGNPEVYLSGASDAIDGNSFILDYTGLVKPGSARIYVGFGNLFRQGRWILEFDAKILSGSLANISGEDNGEFCIFPVGQNVAYRWTFRITDEKTHVRIDLGAKRFIDQNSAAILVRAADNDYSDLKIAFDNVRITYTKTTYPETTPTGTVARISSDADWLDTTQSTATYVINGNNGAGGTYTLLSGSGSPVYLERARLVESGILTAEQAEVMTAENGFGDNVIHMFGQLNSIQSLTGALTADAFFDGGTPLYEITITMKAIGSTNNWQLLSNGKGMGGSWTGDGVVKTYTWSGLADKALQEIGMYNGGVGDIFIGEITISRTGHVDVSVTPSGLLTAPPAWNEDRIVLQGDASSLTALDASAFIGQANYVDRRLLVNAGVFTQEQYDAIFTAENGFSADDSLPVLYLNGGQTIFFSGLNGLFDDLEDGYNYKITYKGYAVSAANWHVWGNHNSTQGQMGDIATASPFTNTVEIVKNAAFTKAGIYTGVAIELYISQIIVERVAINTSVDVVVEPANLLTAAPAWDEDRIVLQGSAALLTAADTTSLNGVTYYVDRTKLVEAEIFTSEQYAAAFAEANGFSADTSVPVLYIKGGQTVYFSALNGLFDDLEDGYTYTLTYKGYAVSASNWHVWGNHSGSSLGGLGDVSTPKPFSITVDIIKAANFTKAGIYCGGSLEIYISEIVVVRKPINTEVQVEVKPEGLLTAPPAWDNDQIVLQGSVSSLTAADTTPPLNGEAYYVDRTKLVEAGMLSQEQYDAAFTEDNGFTADTSVPVLYIKGSNTLWFSALNGLFSNAEDGYTYTLTYKGYAVSSSNWHVWGDLPDAGNALKGQISDTAANGFAKTVTFTANSSFTKAGLYTGGSFEVYISQIVVTRTLTNAG